MCVAKGKEATAEIELQDVAANIRLLDLLQRGEVEIETDMVVLREKEKECDSVWRASKF